ncbi:MAG: radical SAM protein [Candidatus Gracilibacteria bacterium]|nr:radical SAM protein [Candidatus Gracilibacteria bacterium]
MNSEENSNILENSGFIYIGDNCNAKCYFCFSKGNIFKTKQEIFLLIDYYIGLGLSNIRYGMGEFTIHPDFFEILEYGKKKGINQFINTNGITLSDNKFVERLVLGGIKNINVSLHGIHSLVSDKILGIKGAFKHTIKGIENLKRNGISISIAFVMTSDNINQILGIYIFCLKNKISLLKISILMGGKEYKGNIIPKLFLVQAELIKLIKLNSKVNLNIKLLNIPYCIISNNLQNYIFENGGNSVSHKLKDCEKCKFNNDCCGFPIYYKKNDFSKIIKTYVKNQFR